MAFIIRGKNELHRLQTANIPGPMATRRKLEKVLDIRRIVKKMYTFWNSKRIFWKLTLESRIIKPRSILDWRQSRSSIIIALDMKWWRCNSVDFFKSLMQNIFSIFHHLKKSGLRKLDLRYPKLLGRKYRGENPANFSYLETWSY